MAGYIDTTVANGGRTWHVVRHMLGLCNGLAGARQFRRHLSEQCSGNDVTSQVLFDAFAKVTVPANE
jgi:tRNA-dihydrouridine synthase A